MPNIIISSYEPDKYQLGFIWEEIHLMNALPWDSTRKYWGECISAKRGMQNIRPGWLG